MGYVQHFLDEFQYGGNCDSLTRLTNRWLRILTPDRWNDPGYCPIIWGDAVSILLTQDSLPSVSGARSNPDPPLPDVIPIAQFQTSPDGTERNRWTALMDFYVDTAPNSPDPHATIFLRVRPVGTDNQTRFGCAVEPPPSGGKLGVVNPENAFLQFTGLISGILQTPSPVPFDITENPFENLFKGYRVQIEEREANIGGSWTAQWKAGLVDLATATSLGTTPWTARPAGMALPDLPGSGILFGFGPGFNGRIIALRVATLYWSYAS